jgi:nucleoside-diphosphate-sugar epimerase
LPGGGKSRIPFTYIGNIAHAVKLTLGNSSCFGRTFIVGDEDSYSLREVVLALAQGMGVKVKILTVPGPVAYAAARMSELAANLRGSTPLLDRGRLQTMTNSVSYSIAAFQTATGYQPPYSLRQAAQRIAAWYREHNGL